MLRIIQIGLVAYAVAHLVDDDTSLPRPVA